MKKHLAAFALALCPSVAIAQQTLVVGAGQAFTEIAPAVAAAQTGDTVLVMPGTYPADFVINKGIQVISQGARIESVPFTLTGAVIEDVPVGETCVFAGFSVDGSSTTAGDVTLTVRNCGGAVILRELRQTSLKIWFLGIENCSQVEVGEGVVRRAYTVDSNVVFEHIVFDALFFSGLSATGGRVVVVACTVNGGQTAFGGPAIDMAGAELAVTRSSMTASAPKMPAIMTNEGVLVLDPSCTLGSATGQTVTGTAAVVPLEFHSLATRYDEVNSELELENHGVAGQVFATVMSPVAGPLPTPLGVAWVDPFALVVIDVNVYGPTRSHSTVLPLPPLPSGLSVALQSVVFLPTNLTLSTPSLLTID